MSKLTALLWLLSGKVALAHHTKNHMMLAEETERVIASTHGGSGGGQALLIWSGTAVILALGFVRWWNGRK